MQSWKDVFNRNGTIIVLLLFIKGMQKDFMEINSGDLIYYLKRFLYIVYHGLLMGR